MKTTALIPIINVDSGKCLNCHACISACPVKYCNDGSGSSVSVNHDMCIGCGKCIVACTHGARSYIDDFKRFLSDVISGEKIIAVVSPATAASFPTNYLKINTFFKEIGIDAVFDVSFGAELTVKSYLNELEIGEQKTIIAQPCAAIVTYIELYQPELIKYLAPADSPMLHTIKMVREFYPDYKHHKVAVLSPCNAKKREFEETGLGDYNIAIQSLVEFFKDSKTDINSLPETDFDNPPAERAVLFSSPGGLLKTAERWNPEIADMSRKIEGTPNVYHYFKSLPAMISEGKAPLLIDCLSCEFGCNAGPLTAVKDVPQDEIEYRISNRSKYLKNKYLQENNFDVKQTKHTLEKLISQYWREDLYTRTYVNRWKNVTLKYPNAEEISDIYERMHKYSDADVKNCSSCGYNSCHSMATAIFNGLNRPENCHFYMEKETDLAHVKTKQSSKKLSDILETSLEGFVELNKRGEIMSANRAFKKLLKRNDIIGRSVFEFSDRNPNELMQQLTHGAVELELKQSDGNTITCLVSASLLNNIEGENIGSFAMVTNISKLKQAELQLRDANENLEQKVKIRTAQLNEAYEEVLQRNEEISQQREEIEAQRDALYDSEQRIKIVLESMPDAAFMINEHGLVTFWNQAMVSLTGISSYDILGKGDYEYALPFYGKKQMMLIDLVHHKQEELPANYPNVIFDNGILQAEIHIESLNGKPKHIIGRAVALFDTDGNPNGAIEILHDTTEQHNFLKKIEAQKHDITSSIHYAARIQDAVLPASSQINLLLDNYFILYKPKDIVSGDFYWIKNIDNTVIIAVADCTGHGVPGAFMSMLGNTFLNEIIVKDRNASPDKILFLLRERIKHALRQNSDIGHPADGMDMALLVHTPGEDTVYYSGANNPLYVVRSGNLLEFKADRMPIGLHRLDNKPFTLKYIDVEPDDVFYLFSDGYRDQTGGLHGRKFMTANFRNLIVEIHGLPFDTQKQILEQKHIEWKGTVKQIDDILVIGFKLKQTLSETVDLQ